MLVSLAKTSTLAVVAIVALATMAASSTAGNPIAKHPVFPWAVVAVR